MSNARELAQIPSTPSGRRNLIINGAMNVAQRGTSPATGLTETSDGYKTVDRWKYVASGSSNTGQITMSYETDAPDDFKYSTKYLVTTADTDMGSDGAVRIETHLEAQDLRHLNYGSSDARQVTLSFWVKSNKTGTYSSGLYMDSIASGSDNEISQGYTINSADTWEYKTLTFAGNTTTVMNATDNDHGLRVWFFSAAGSDSIGGSSNVWSDLQSHRAVDLNVNLYDTVNNYWQVTGVQLEVGSVATEFEHRSYGEELALCQRYYQSIDTNSRTQPIGFGIRQTTNIVRFSIPTPVALRADPSIVISGTVRCLESDGSLTQMSSISGLYTSNGYAVASGTATGVVQGSITISAFGGIIQIDAEL